MDWEEGAAYTRPTHTLYPNLVLAGVEVELVESEEEEEVVEVVVGGLQEEEEEEVDEALLRRFFKLLAVY